MERRLVKWEGISQVFQRGGEDEKTEDVGMKV